jgi:hypothetical protein
MNTEKIQQAARELQNYFRKSLLKGEFEITEFRQTSILANIAGFTFHLILHNEGKFAFFGSSSESYMRIQLTDEDEKHLYSLILPEYKKWVNGKLIAEKEAELLKLKEL